jgi:hypothetical protein
MQNVCYFCKREFTCSGERHSACSETHSHSCACLECWFSINKEMDLGTLKKTAIECGKDTLENIELLFIASAI